MRTSTLVAIIFVLAVGLLSYREGYLSKIHPILAPASEEENSGAAVEMDEESLPETNRSDVDGTEGEKPEKPAPVSKKEAKPKQTAEEKELEKKQRAEQARLEKETRDAERAKLAEQREAERQARLAHNDALTREIDELSRQISSIEDQIRTTRQKLSAQENTWVHERIKTREAEKESFRESVRTYESKLRDEISKIKGVIAEKLALFK
jgi:hypothetical protein